MNQQSPLLRQLTVLPFAYPSPMPRPLFAVLLFALVGLGCRERAAETAATPSARAPQYASLTTFPPLGLARPVDDGIVVHRVALGQGRQEGRIWIYLPEKLPAKPMGCVFIAPAGVPPFVGNGFGIDLDAQEHPEHLPYVRAGFAVVAYDTDGELANAEDPTFDQVQQAAAAFKDARAGVLNARRAIDYVLKMVPAIDPQRLYSAGHSSAGRIALLVAESEPRIAACVAYAPVTDVERRVEQNAPDAARYLEANLAGFRDFLKDTSPVRQAAKIRCPVLVFHAEDDSIISIIDTEAFVESLKKTNPRVTFVRARRGDHYDSMIEEGVPQGIAWLRELEKR
jgi:dienelactone hydrolase